MFFGILFFLPVLSTVVNGEGVAKESAGCQYLYFAETAVDGSLLKLHQKVKNFDACLTECAKYNVGASGQKCDAITFSAGDGACFLRGLTPGQAIGKMTYDLAGAETAIIKSCNVVPPTSTIGCGMQDSEFMPELFNSKRIMGGREAKPNTWPWMVRLAGSGYCGASLIPVRDGLDETDMVLTAGHCLRPRSENPDYTKTSVKAGRHDLDKNEATEAVRNIAIVKFYNESDYVMNNDIALIRLNAPIKFTKVIRPICLPSATDPLAVDKPCYFTGWGRNNPDNSGESARRLKQAELPVHDDETCKRLSGWMYVPPRHTCAGNGVTTVCMGDSGGPLVCQHEDKRWFQYGLSSYVVAAKGCRNFKTPAGFTRIQTYANWIQSSIKEMSTLA